MTQQTPSSFTIFVYPLQHNARGRARRTTVERLLADGWAPWIDRLTRDKGTQPLEDAFNASYYFRSAIRKKLFPEFSELKRGSDTWRTEAGAMLKEEWSSRAKWAAKLEKQKTIRFTLSDAELEPWKRARIIYEPSKEYTSFTTHWVDLYLHEDGGGYLAIKILPELSSMHPQVELARFNEKFRALLPATSTWKLSNLVPEDMEETTTRKWVDGLLRGLDATPSTYLSRDDAWEQGGNFYIYSYLCKGELTELPDALSSVDKFEAASVAAYEIATAKPMIAPNVPAVDYLRDVLKNHQFAMWSDWTVVSRPEGTAFVSRTGDSSALARNTENIYFYIYLFTLHQRAALVQLQGELMKVEERKSSRQIRDLFEKFIDFRKGFWPAEISSADLGGRLFQLMQQGLATQTLYEAVGSQVEELHEYSENRLALRTNGLINFIAFLGFPVTAVAAFLSIEIQDWTKDGISMPTAIALHTSAAVLGGFLWLSLMAFRDRKKR